MSARRTAAVCLAAAGIAATAASPAFAGEVTGNGKNTQGPAHANSICVFSGLNDEPDAPGPEGGRVQNFGHVLRFVTSMGGSIEDLKAAGENPGAACNGHTGFFAGGGSE